MKLGVYVLVLILLANLCCAATIHGSVYDLSLEKVEDVIVEVNSSPSQRFVVKAGEYSFVLPKGSYKIMAKQVVGNITRAETEELLSVVDDGEYVLDLFLFPSFEEEEDLFEDTEITVPFADMRTTNYLLVGVLVMLVVLFVAVFWLFRRSKQPKVVMGSDDLQKVVNIIKAQGGRTTQKEIRRHMPYSEAKVSLIIAELEVKGVVEKFKKGRGNIVVLK